MFIENHNMTVICVRAFNVNHRIQNLCITENNVYSHHALFQHVKPAVGLDFMMIVSLMTSYWTCLVNSEQQLKARENISQSGIMLLDYVSKVQLHLYISKQLILNELLKTL